MIADFYRSIFLEMLQVQIAWISLLSMHLGLIIFKMKEEQLQIHSIESMYDQHPE